MLEPGFLELLELLLLLLLLGELKWQELEELRQKEAVELPQPGQSPSKSPHFP